MGYSFSHKFYVYRSVQQILCSFNDVHVLLSNTAYVLTLNLLMLFCSPVLYEGHSDRVKMSF